MGLVHGQVLPLLPLPFLFSFDFLVRLLGKRWENGFVGLAKLKATENRERRGEELASALILGALLTSQDVQVNASRERAIAAVTPS